MGISRVRGLTAFVLAVDAISVAALLSLPTASLWERTHALLLLAGLTVLAGVRPVHIPLLNTGLIATHPFVLCALAVAGPRAAGLVALIGTLGASLAMARRYRPIHLAFNLGAVVLSTAIAAWMFVLAGGAVDKPALTLIWPLTLATAGYFIGNTGLVTTVIAVEKGQSWLETWKHSCQWATVSFVTGLSLAVGLLLVLQTIGPWGLALGVPPMWLLASYYRANAERLEEHRRRIQEVEALNADLERRVEERTRDLQQALARIEELQALKRTLTQTLVHDLKNPLTAVVGNLDLLEMRTEEPALKWVRRSKDGASRLLRMILDLLDVSGMEENRFVIDPKPVDLVQLVRLAVEVAEATASQQGAGLELESSDECRVQVDPSAVGRVVDNLLTNALQHSPVGSSVTVGVAMRGGRAEITVADQGTGIPEKFREKVFEKYARGELRDAGVSANRGLGLTFCKMAVEAHGGSIRAEAAPGGGALFRVALPAMEADGLDTTDRPETELETVPV